MSYTNMFEQAKAYRLNRLRSAASPVGLVPVRASDQLDEALVIFCAAAHSILAPKTPICSAPQPLQPPQPLPISTPPDISIDGAPTIKLPPRYLGDIPACGPSPESPIDSTTWRNPMTCPATLTLPPATPSLIVPSMSTPVLNTPLTPRSESLPLQPYPSKPIHPLEFNIPIEEKDQDFVKKYSSCQLSRFLGRGQSGSVFLGENDQGEPIFAIKAVHLPGSVGIGLPIRTTFLLYQKVLRLLDHPHINPYLGWTVIETEGQVYSAYCNGGTLRQAVYKNESDPGIKDIETVKRWIYQIVSALVYLHDHGMVHRDIKPDNILLHNGECRISDLGSSRLHQHCCCDPHQKKISGTPAYTPPEAVTSQIAFDTCAEDIWGVGCCLYEMVMGESPWSDCDGVFSIYFTLGSFYKAYTDSSDTLHDQSGVCREPPRDEGLSGDPDTDSASDDGDDNGGFSGHPLVERAAARGDLDSDGIDFLKACLEWDPYQRPLAIQLLQMPFLASVGK